MIVDDEDDIRSSVEKILTSNGYEVVTAKDADDCLKKLKTVKPDLILMDIMMPGTPVKKIVPKIKNTNIAYLSVVRLADAEKEGLIFDNVVDFIQKPFNMDELLQKVRIFSKKRWT